jgi:hypothetical protein
MAVDTVIKLRVEGIFGPIHVTGETAVAAAAVLICFGFQRKRRFFLIVAGITGGKGYMILIPYQFFMAGKALSHASRDYAVLG